MTVSFSHQERGHIRWDVLASASSVPNTHGKSAKLAGLRSAVMSFTRIYIVAFLLIHALCNAATTESREIKVNDSDSVERPIADDAADAPDAAEGGREEEKEQQENVEEILPILPPIILLDFDNGTIESNTTDEKSKRTVNNGLGYGFDRNSVPIPRKYNYYFPAGKTGTTVSIEESISPFLPRTIIEKVPPIDQKSISDSFADFGHQRTRGSARSSYQFYNPATKSSPVFGLRTKLTKTSDSEPYQGFTPIARPSVDAYSNVDYQEGAYASTTPQSLAFGPEEAVTSPGYATPSPQSYTASSSSRYTYVTPSPSYVQRYVGQSSQRAINVQGYPRPKQSAAKPPTSSPLEAATLLEQLNSHNYARPGSNAAESSTPRPDDVSGYQENAGPFPDLPRYTVENGVRYENKIFWKYPDGRVSDVPPMTYETYSDYPSLAALQAAKTQDASSQIYESASTESSVMSQGPVQFPMAPEPIGPRTPFISMNTLSRLQQQQQTFRLGYQNYIGQKQAVSQQAKAGSGVSPTYSVSSAISSPLRDSLKSTGKYQKNRYETLRRPTSKYMVNSPNPEYIDNIEKNARLTRLYAQSAGGSSAKKINAAGGKNLDGYSNLQYSDLLNYNPSISQYIKNPASILNVQPTFVQAGSSLIPVIILRVDGVPPIQPKASPNVNLKALLQQYLVQYAKSIEELTRQTNYDLGDDQAPKDQNSFSTSPLHELARLASNSGVRDLIGNPTESYIGKSSYEASNLDVERDLSGGKYGERTAARPKVKSVQIIEDPRLANHRP
ncbi:LOW QUALITY PROTEIN: uncharacterized protein LOC143902183 [Temnothorax americanus]|uniref:LOW QUALITY PROTEIN: uncharacterized protein LOC143902183 n=1 Tax=Temnothorax americanus TaxID=1964332 RepID=UPI004067CDA1